MTDVKVVDAPWKLTDFIRIAEEIASTVPHWTLAPGRSDVTIEAQFGPFTATWIYHKIDRPTVFLLFDEDNNDVFGALKLLRDDLKRKAAHDSADLEMHPIYQSLRDAVEKIWGALEDAVEGARPPANVVRELFRQARAERPEAEESDDAAQ